MGLNDELTRRIAEGAVGGAIRVIDLPGVGPAIKSNLATQGFRSVPDIKEATVDELTDVIGIGESTAREMIRAAGGDPRENQRQRRSTGSVSAAGIRGPVGDFKVDIGDLDKAEARNEGRGITRSEEAVIADNAKRAPVTTDLELWKDNKGRLDFPGVDTPTNDPELRRDDLMFVDEDDLTDSGLDRLEELRDR